MHRFPIIYQDKQITITKDFISLPKGEREIISIASISGITVTRNRVGNYKNAGILFFIVGVFTIAFGIGWLFLAWGIGAMLTNVYEYNLKVIVDGRPVLLLTGKGGYRLKSLAKTIHGLSLSKSLVIA